MTRSIALRIFDEIDGPLGREPALRVAAAVDELESMHGAVALLRAEVACKTDLAAAERDLRAELVASERRLREELVASERRLGEKLAASELSLREELASKAEMREGFARARSHTNLLFGITLAAVLFTNREAIAWAAQLLHLLR